MLNIEDPQRQQSAASAGFALWNLGFRPFYLLASSFAALSILLWICQYTGHLPAIYPIRDSRGGRQCGVSGDRRHRNRHPHRAEPEPAQLFLHRAAVAAWHRRAGVPSCASGYAPVAGTGEPAGWTRSRSVHHGRHGRAGDSDVHQQWRTWRESLA
jgi:hypothetical protein